MAHETTIVTKKKKQKGRLSTVQKVVIAIVLIIYTVILAAVSFWVFYKPSVSHEVPFDIPETDENGNKIIIVDDAGNEVKDKRRKEDSYNFLILGRDANAFLTDVMMVANLDTSTGSMSIMQIPRDTFVSGGYPTGKLNAVYSTLYHDQLMTNGNNESDAAKVAREGFTSLIENGLSVKIDYTVVMNLSGFRRIVDILGGVDVNVPFTMSYNDPDQGLYINIPAGWQHLDGNAAEGFVRYRYGYALADLARQDAQKQFMFALVDKMKSTLKITEAKKISDVIGAIYENVETNVTLEKAIYFAKCLLGVDSGNIKMLTIPGSLPQNGYFVINRRESIDVINQYFNVWNFVITDQIFDQGRTFNNEYDYLTNDAYYSYESTFGGNVYESGSEISIAPAG